MFTGSGSIIYSCATKKNKIKENIKRRENEKMEKKEIEKTKGEKIPRDWAGPCERM